MMILISSPTKKTQSGFTLIVMLIIIVLLAIIFTVAANMQKLETNTLLINNTAVEMKNYLEAAQAYYADNGYWPCDISALTSASNNAFALQKGCGQFQLSDNNTICPGQNSYRLGFLPVGSGCGNPQDPTQGALPLATQLLISTTAPSDKIATQIATQIPNGEANNPTNQVSATVGPPDQTDSISNQMQQEGLIAMTTVYSDLIGKKFEAPGMGGLAKHLGDTNGLLQVTLPSCPPSWSPNYDVAQMQVYVNQGSAANALRGIYICKTGFSFNYSGQDIQTTIATKTDMVSTDDLYAASALILTYCRPPGYPNPTTLSPDPTRLKNLINTGDASNCYFASTT